MNEHKFTLHIFTLVILTGLSWNGVAQLPSPALIGYWHNWNAPEAPYIELDEVDSRYNVVNISFGIPINGTDYEIGFTPAQVPESTLIDQIQTLQSQGRKVLLSIGGANDPIKLDNSTEKNVFISSLNDLISTYGFDGIDIDLEGSSLSVSGGTIANPTDNHIIHLIDAIKSIMLEFQLNNSKKLLLTFAPETAFVQGGQSAWSGIWGAYLPVLHALRDSLDLVHVQLYNSGSMYGIDGNIYSQGSADFIVAMTEAVIQGFNVDRWSNQAGPFIGLPQTKIAVGLPACPNAAGGGFVDTATVGSALRYLLGTGPKPGNYTLINGGGYPNLGGMMTWSINWDNVNTCNNSAGQYADNFERLFLNPPLPVELLSFTARLFEDEQVLLQWQTASEINNHYFGVERSDAGVHWEILAYIPGDPNSLTLKSYQYIDSKPLDGRSYYRLQQKDLDGEISYSPIVSIFNAKSEQCNVYPNPVKNFLFFDEDCPGEQRLIYLYNNLGTLVFESLMEKGKRLDLHALPPGLYFLVSFDSTNLQKLHTVEFVKSED